MCLAQGETASAAQLTKNAGGPPAAAVTLGPQASHLWQRQAHVNTEKVPVAKYSQSLVCLGALGMTVFLSRGHSGARGVEAPDPGRGP